MNSVSVAAAAATDTTNSSAGKVPPPSSVQSESVDCTNNCSSNNNNSDKGSGIPAASTLAARDEEGVAVGTAQVVIIKAESCEETVTNVIQNGATAGGAIKGVTMNSSSGAEGAAAVLENGTVESLEAGVSKVAINGTNQNRMIRTASAKGKHLTRSHAMRESASPPRTPTICNGGSSQSQSQTADEHETGADSHPALTPEVITPPKIYPADGGKATSQLDLDFPKLNAPKPKSPRNMEKSQSSSDSSKSVNSLDPHSPTATLNRKGEGLSRNLSPSSQHSNKELSAMDHDSSPLLSPGSYDNRSGSGREHSKSPSGENRNSNYHGNSGGKKHKGASAAKNAKTPRLKAQGSSSSVEGNNNSTVFISKDNSFEQFTDQSGVDLIKFFRETLNKNTKDRSMLLKIEKELHDLATDRNRHQVKFPSMSSYNRMLIHRCAAYFGMDHNVDTSQTSVIVAVTKSTRIPEILFHTLLRDTLDEPRKSILKRDSHSFDECRQSLLPNPDRGLLDRKAKSFEEREEEYEKARRRIFKGREMVGYGRSMDMQDENSWPWSSTESSDNSTKIKAQNNRLLKVHSLSVDTRHDRPSVSKSHSFGGYGGPSGGGGNHHSHHLNRGDSITSTKSAGPRFFTKQDSIGGTPWRLSPSSSGYKTQTQSLRSDSITPSPTGYGSGGDHTPEPQSAQSPGAAGNRSVVWAVTDMASVPRGSVLIDPQTLQPIVNQDGSIYYFDPSNVPAIAMKMTPHGQMNRHYPPPFMTGGGGGSSSSGGGGGGHPSNRRRTERNKGPGEEMGSVGSKEKSISNTGSIDVIPEDQLQANCAPTDVNATAANSGSAVPSEEGSQYTKGETPSPEDLEDTTSDKGGMTSVEAVDDLMEDNVERIFVPEHKNQATSPCHPMAEQCEEFVVAAASDSELASSSQCLTPQPTSPTSPTSPPPPLDEQEHQPLQSPPPPSSSTMTIETEAIEVPSTEPTDDDPAEDVGEEVTVTAAHEALSERSGEVEGDSAAAVAVEGASAAVVPNARPIDSHTMTISTTCTSSSSTHSNAAPAESNTAARAEEAQTSSGGSYSAPPRTYHKPFNRYNNHNSQGEPRSGSTTIASPSNTSTGYPVHQQQYVAQAPLRHEDQMQAYQSTGITYSTTAVDANGNTYATGASNMPYTATYQQMPESGGYMFYAAPYPMETVGEMPGYYVPVYDQAGNATLVPASTGARDHQQTTTILQAAPPPGTAVYQAAPNTTLIPALPAGSQLVYAPEGQFGAASMQPPQQFAASYPPGTTVTYAPYGTAYNAPSTYHPNFWGQPMTTYYVSSPPTAQAVQQATALPIQIPVQMPQQPVNTQPQTVKSGTHSSPQTPQASTFAGNPFNTAGGHLPMNVSVNGVMGEAMPPPIYAVPMGGGGGHSGGGPHHGPSKYQNVNMYPYSAPVVPASATPPTAIYQPSQPYQPPGPLHSGGAGKAGVALSPPHATVGGSCNDPQTNPSSTTSTPLQKSPPTQMPETASSSAGSGYERKARRGPPTEMSGSTQSQQNTGPPPRTHGYLGNNYNSAYARNPNQTYTPRGYAPKKHYGTEGGAPNGMGHNKPIVLNAPLSHQSSPSPGIYSHYHHPSAASAAAGAGVQGPHSHHSHPAGIRGPRPKPANLDLRRTGSHYQTQSVGGAGGAAAGASVSVAGNGNSQRNTPSTNSTESNNSPNSVTGGGGGAGAVSGGHGNGMGDHHGRSSNGQMGYYPAPNAGGVPHHSGHPLVMHQPLMGSPANAVGPGGHPGMYVKLGQTYFPHPTIATPMGGNRRSPPNEMRPQFNHHPHSLTTGLYPMNMQISGPRHGASGPRHSHHNSYKGSR